jgi:RNA polymerase sigma factor (sigma-70 family)
MGSVIDGEDVVQDTLVRAFVALQDLEEAPLLRPWLFRIARNRALDLPRSREVRLAEPIDAAADVADSAQPDPLEMLMREEAIKTAVSRFVELPTVQRSVVILKDVLDQSLIEIAALLDLSLVRTGLTPHNLPADCSNDRADECSTWTNSSKAAISIAK